VPLWTNSASGPRCGQFCHRGRGSGKVRFSGRMYSSGRYAYQWQIGLPGDRGGDSLPSRQLPFLRHPLWKRYGICAKYRRKVFYEEKRAEVGAILRQLVKYILADTTLQLHKPYIQKILCDAICESCNSLSPWNSVQLPSIFGSASPTCRSRRRHYKR